MKAGLMLVADEDRMGAICEVYTKTETHHTICLIILLHIIANREHTLMNFNETISLRECLMDLKN